MWNKYFDAYPQRTDSNVVVVQRDLEEDMGATVRNEAAAYGGPRKGGRGKNPTLSCF